MIRRIGRPSLLGMAARTAVVAGTATAVSGAVHNSQQSKQQTQADAAAYQAQQQQAAMDAAAAQAVANAQAQAPAAAPAPAAGGVDVVAELQKLAGLKDAGILSDDEFAAAKAKLLA